MRWLGAGGDPSPSPSGLEDGKVLMGASKVTWLLAPLCTGGPGRTSRGYHLFF